LTADKFVVLPENAAAFQAAQQLRSKVPAGRIRGLFIHGPAGAGKTHLAKVAGTLVQRGKPDLVVCYLTGSQILEALAEASVDKAVHKFQAALPAADYIILDDIPALEGRAGTQQQLLAYLDERLAAHADFVFISTKLPGELHDFHRKLVSRFRACSVIPVTLPGPASRKLLIEHFASREQAVIPPAAVQRMAESLPVSPRELAGAVQQLLLMARRERLPVDDRLVQRLLKQEVFPPQLTPVEIMRAVAREFDVVASKLKAETRLAQFVLPRQSAMYLCRELTGLSLQEIAAAFSKRDHTTVLHACQRISARLADDAELRQRLARVQRALKVDQRRVEKPVRKPAAKRPSRSCPP
jgi:chromosomal replication initiator protein